MMVRKLASDTKPVEKRTTGITNARGKMELVYICGFDIDLNWFVKFEDATYRTLTVDQVWEVA